MSGPFGPSDPGEGRNDPTQQWGGQQAPGQQPPGQAGPTQHWGGQPQQTPSSAQPTQHWGDQQQPQPTQQQWGQQQPPQQWGQQPSQPSQPAWGQQSQPQWGQQPQQDWQQPQQQWGQQPQWGQQQPVPSSGGKGKGLIIGLVIGGLVIIGAVVALVVLLTAKDKLDNSAVQDGVKKVLSDSYGIQDVSEVSCPSGQEVTIDRTFDCSLKVSGEQKKVTVKITKDDGTYEVGRPN
ncbi:DUF4333 domain-containing protein [Nocardia sp. NPDC052566]|uniref:DUF4333 domain-containing protein n=1 Tax=Nocardia sp. NPDC052566 TaxID=3364330 RepID=UPI0037C70676